MKELLRSPESVIIEIQSKNPLIKDNLINAWQISKSIADGDLKNYGMSEQIAKKFIENTTNFIKSLPLKDSTDFGFKKYRGLVISTLFLIAVFAITSHYFPMDLLRPSLRIERFLTVSPKDASIPYGESVVISAKLFWDYIYEPTLNLRSGAGRFSKLKMRKSALVYTYEFKNLVEDIEYFISWCGMRSRRYTIKPIIPPTVNELYIEASLPSYTKLPKVTLKRFDEIPLLKGSVLKFEGICNKELKEAAFLNNFGLYKKLSIERERFKGAISVDKSQECWFELEGIDGSKNTKPVKYKIILVDDIAPKVEIISPAQDLIISKYDRFPLVYNLKDDFGFTKVELICEGRYSGYRRVVSLGVPKQKDYIGEYEFDAFKLGLPQDDLITYYIVVYDNDAVTGPKKSESKRYTVEIFSYKVEKREIEDELKHIRDEILELLGEQVRAKQSLQDMLISTPPYSHAAIQELLMKQKNVLTKSQKMLEKISKAIGKMQQNPHFDNLAILEQQIIKGDMEYLVQNQMQEAIDLIEKQNFHDAGEIQDEIIKALERMATISERSYKYRNTVELLNTIDTAQDLAGELADILESEKIDEETMKKLNEVFNEINEMLNEIQNLIEKMPKELPDEFINQPAVKELNFGEISSLMNKLDQSLKSKDFKSALKHAKDLLKQIRSLHKNLNEAFQQMNLPLRMNEVAQKIQKELDKINQLIEQQSGILDKTNPLEMKRQRLMFEKQKEIMKQLLEKQKKVIDITKVNTEKVKASISKHDFRNLLIQTLNDKLSKMETIYEELKEAVIKDSVKLLKDVINRCQAINKDLNRYLMEQIQIDEARIVREMKFDISYVESVEMEILKMLESQPSVEFSKDDINKMKELSSTQGKLKHETEKVASTLKAISEEVPLIGTETLLNLYNASREMGNSSANLLSYQTNKSIGNQQKALEYLQQASEGLNQMVHSLQKASGGIGQANIPSIQGRSGVYGVRVGIVKLPDKNKFIPSKELKEEIIKSLKERYPQIHEDVIREYFERIMR